MKVSVFGLGIIGAIWARHYESAGLLAAAWNRSPKPETPRWQPDIVAAARAGEVLQIVVADPPAVAGLLDAIAPALGPGKIVVQSSTIDPASSERFRQLVEARGAEYVEAPFTGSKPAAEARKTVFYLGGAESVVAQVEPVLANLSEFRFRIGTNAQASALKLAMNLQIAGLMEALCEGITFARRAGIADDKFFEVIGCNVANSGLVKLKEPKVRAGDFAPQFSVKHMCKDLRLAVETAGEGVLPQTTLVRDRLREAEKRGWADEDFSALLKLL
ncbi:MAG TPA: NAD(P)-dependent oxidoreductase [Opitutaceae bacterium]|nr:NAD(P)-dependent oxidoreductase [Opitutaceae bacterium]